MVELAYHTLGNRAIAVKCLCCFHDTAKPSRAPPKIHPKLHSSHLQESLASKESKDSLASKDEPVQTGLGTEEKGRGKGEGSPVEAVPQVVQAIGQISNYFGSTPAQSSGQPATVAGQQLAGRPEELAEQPGEPAGQENTEVLDTGGKAAVSGAKVSSHVTSQQENTTIGLLSYEDIGSLAGEIAQQFQDGEEEASKEETEVPSYAPEKCSTSDSSYSSKLEPGKGSPLPITTLPLPEAGGSVGEAEVSKLEGMLVSEKDIFGAALPDDTDDEGEGGGGDMGEGLGGGNEGEGAGGGDEGEGLGDGDEGPGDDTDMVDGGNHGDADGGNHGDADGGELTLSQAEMMEEFKKLTSLSQDKLSKSCST